MTTAVGTMDIPEAHASIPPTPTADLDAAVASLKDRAKAWQDVDVPARIALLDELIEDTLAAAPAWAVRGAEAKGIARDSPLMGEDWLYGPNAVLGNLQRLKRTLTDVLETGRPQPPEIGVAPNGQVVAKVFPADVVDQLTLTGFSGEIRLLPDVTLDQAVERMGRIYRPGGKPEPGVALVLGAGNVSSIGPMDLLYKLFAEDRVCILKMNPVNEHLGPHIGEAFQALVREGFLRIVYGGSAEGAHLCEHPDVTEIHITGSDKTHDVIVFGPGEEGAKRKAANDPKLTKPISSELGNVSPVIVVPGPWSDSDIAFHGESIASMLVQNGGFNCVAARVIVTHRSWARRSHLLNAVRDSLRVAAPREPYYPGAVDRWRAFTGAHGQSEWFGEEGDDKVPFTLIPELDPDAEDDIAFTTEAFCGVMGEVPLDAPRSVVEYIEQAVEFCNDRLWGSLSASIIVHPKSLEDPLVADAVERAIDQLRYGSVIVNHWSGVLYGMVSPSWGAYPGHTPEDIGSGTGVVHNTFLLEDVEKSVCRGPFRLPLKPPWFHTHKQLAPLAKALTAFTATRDPRAFSRLLWAAARG
ncbi:aldehyde dehydrogenase family protein [Nitriliruptor alkaliphilus]|uniref:aldehyde dehydrogenase family protein n=1 Tax=Nitriliruptor alkaliphilus TaxID=427918 RepID=UPI000697BCAC|nr:aldehyde dehydrogenase family protein [Nitriliruptor alkaliphilus]